MNKEERISALEAIVDDHTRGIAELEGLVNPINIVLNGEPFELERPVTVSKLLEQLNIDPRRVAVEHNLVVLKRAAYDSTLLKKGDEVEVVNFVGGGTLTFDL